ncbi:MAG: hypothetical protein JW875_01900 [Spirochaetales bacterium]|nr:hypothetical protein [Spirochaetales bacterium]
MKLSRNACIAMFCTALVCISCDTTGSHQIEGLTEETDPQENVPQENTPQEQVAQKKKPPEQAPQITGSATLLGPVVFPSVYTEPEPETVATSGEADGFAYYEIKTRDGKDASYYLRFPANYNSAKNTSWPLVVHNNIFATLEYEYRDRDDCFILAATEGLTTDRPVEIQYLVAEVIINALTRFNIDRTQMVIGGFSAGSSGAFQFASFFYHYTGIPFAYITRNAGKEFNEELLDFTALSNSFIWFHVGSEEYDNLQGYDSPNRSWPLLKARDHYAAIREAHRSRGETITERIEYHASADWIRQEETAGNTTDHYVDILRNYGDKPLYSIVNILMANGIEVARKSEYQTDGHDAWSRFVIDYPTFVFSHTKGAHK